MAAIRLKSKDWISKSSFGDVRAPYFFTIWLASMTFFFYVMTHPFLTKQIISGVKSKRTLEKIDLIVGERWAVGLADLQQQIPGV